MACQGYVSAGWKDTESGRGEASTMMELVSFLGAISYKRGHDSDRHTFVSNYVGIEAVASKALRVVHHSRATSDIS